jgi:ribokinase
MTRVAVIGHVEWVEFVQVTDYPPRGGLAQATPVTEHAAGGAVVAAAVLRSLGAEVEFFCALGDDERARRSERELTARGITLHAAHRSQPSRFVFTMLDDGGERTIVTVGERLQPAGNDELDWDRLTTIDGVYFTAGDDGALAAARAARTLVVTPRAGDHAAGLSAAPHVDATVFSADDRDEVGWAADWEPHSRLQVATEGAHGGSWWGESSGRWPAAPLPGPIKDSYGCGDSFAAGLMFGLASGRSVAEAAAIGARCGGEMLTRVGAP